MNHQRTRDAAGTWLALFVSAAISTAIVIGLVALVRVAL